MEGHYDPSQPRVPKGSTNGGQWTTGKGGLTYRSAIEEAHGRGARGDNLRYDKERKAWVDEDGNPVSKTILDRIKQADPPIPPSYIVTINPDPNSSLVAVAKVPSTGKTNYYYDAAHHEAQAAEKFARLKELHESLPGIRSSLGETLASPTSSKADKDAAAVLLLIERTGIRVGGEDTANSKGEVYGATTLLGKHVSVSGDQVSLRFPGKSSIENTRSFRDPALAKYLSGKKLGGEDRVFSVSDGRVRDELHKVAPSFKVKDFRTWHATAIALDEVVKHPLPKDERSLKVLRLNVAKRVSAFLNNTPSVALKHYIDPAVFPTPDQFKLKVPHG